MAKNEIMIRVNVIDYWIDRKLKKAYCLVLFPDIKNNGKESNLRLAESDYHGK